MAARSSQRRAFCPLATASARRRQVSASPVGDGARDSRTVALQPVQLGLVHPLVGLLHLLQRLAEHLQRPVRITRPPMRVGQEGRVQRGPVPRAGDPDR